MKKEEKIALATVENPIDILKAKYAKNEMFEEILEYEKNHT